MAEKKQSIAILGWGSLLWEARPAFDKWHDDWKYDGPLLRIEFSRISDTRSGALTLVIDEEQGVPTTVAWCLSRRILIEDAIEDLRIREGTRRRQIGNLSAGQSLATTNKQRMQTSIYSWARARKLRYVIWTALESNFRRERRQVFSVNSALAYLKSLPSQARLKAFEYLDRAPHFVNTPVRSAYQREIRS